MIGIDMETPKQCATCHFYYMYGKKECFDDNTVSFRCMADLMLRRIYVVELYKKRAKDCPLKEV